MTTTKEKENILLDKEEVLQQAFDDFKIIYSTVKNNDIKSLLNSACELFVEAYKVNNIGLCKSILKTLTDSDRRQALKYIDYIGLSVSYSIKDDSLNIRKFEDFNDEPCDFATFLKNTRERTQEDNRIELINDLTKYSDKAKKQVKNIFGKLTKEQITIFKNIVNEYK